MNMAARCSCWRARRKVGDLVAWWWWRRLQRDVAWLAACLCIHVPLCLARLASTRTRSAHGARVRAAASGARPTGALPKCQNLHPSRRLAPAPYARLRRAVLPAPCCAAAWARLRCGKPRPARTVRFVRMCSRSRFRARCAAPRGLRPRSAHATRVATPRGLRCAPDARPCAARGVHLTSAKSIGRSRARQLVGAKCARRAVRR